LARRGLPFSHSAGLEQGDPPGFLGIDFRYSTRAALLFGQQRTDDAVAARAILEGMAGIQLPRWVVSCRIFGRPARVRPDLDRIELAPETELLDCAPWLESASRKGWAPIHCA
jgi:hypothetical protein